jgi:leucyl-tRNA synthetase
VPLYLADYVLMGYGTGAIMAVPGGDQRTGTSPRRTTSHHLHAGAEDFDGEAYTGDGPAINSEWLTACTRPRPSTKAME